MLKSISKKLLITSLLLILGLASAFHIVKAYNNNYYIKHYQVDIVVNENNTYQITETIDTYFDEGANKHGIIRRIPLRNTIYRQDGSTSSNKVKISDIYVEGGESRIEKDSDEVSIRIGSASEVVEGDVTYVISYLYDIGRDPLKDKDEFYFNIIGNYWDTDIESVDFQITFPKSFDYSSLGFTRGYEGSDNYEGIMWRVEKDVVYGYYHETLGPNEGLSMRLELPEGYFVRPISLFERLIEYIYIIPAAAMALVGFLYKKFGINEKPVEPVEFYPPEGMNSLDVGFNYDGTIDNKDITSLLIHLANQGYVEIHESDKKKYEIHIIEDEYLGNNPEEETFFKGLKSRANKDNIVTESRLDDSFYTVVNKIRKSYSKKNKRSDIIVNLALPKAISIMLGLAMIFISIFYVYYQNTYSVSDAFKVALIGTFVIAFYAPFIYAFFATPGIFAKIIIGGIVGIHLLVIFGISVSFLDRLTIYNKTSIYLGAICLIFGLLSILLGIIMFKRTPYGNELYGRIKGFRNFLEAAEKPKLEELVEQDPTYFYDILPYAHVLGVSSKWIKKFDDIAMEPPTWYSGYGDYDFNRMNRRIENSMNSISNHMSSSTSSSGSSGGFSSSGSSGGGYSGGGSGGGGGSSW